MEWILCAAIHYDDGNEHVHQPENIKTGYVICGRRHSNCIAIKSILTGQRTRREDTQGFLTSKNKFVNREEAMKIAIAANQLENDDTNIGYDLISEDIY